MASYWKSNPRKMCDICKCWIADNKISIEFHERGKSHQEKKKKYLNDVRKRSHKQHKEEQNLESYLRKMESAALKQYSKDQAELGLNPLPLLVASTSQHVASTPRPATTVKKEPKLNIKTDFKQSKKTAGFKPISIKSESTEPPAKVIKKEVVEATPAYSGHPYGAWTTVEVEETPPEVRRIEEKPKEEIIEFHQKKHEVKKLEANKAPVAFKKRKIAHGTRRQRTED